MREILFRGKRKYGNGEWVAGLLWKKKYNTDKLLISCFPDKDDNEKLFVISPETVGQFTGLTDNNGTRIFEGDVVTLTFTSGQHKGEVVFHNGGFCVHILNTFVCLQETTVYKIELNGNKHDNPELLNEREAQE